MIRTVEFEINDKLIVNLEVELFKWDSYPNLTEYTLEEVWLNYAGTSEWTITCVSRPDWAEWLEQYLTANYFDFIKERAVESL